MQQNSKHKSAELLILAGEDLTQKILSENAEQRPKQRRHQQTAEQREHLSMNFEC